MKLAFLRRNGRQENTIQYPHQSGKINVAVLDGIVSTAIQNKLRRGTYEKHEAETIPALMQENEILMELGAGVGVISTLAWVSGHVKEVHCFEADPRLIDLIRSTHSLNGVTGFVYNEILSSDPRRINQGTMDFHIRENFYGSSASTKVGREIKETVTVSVSRFQDALDRIRPTVIACDIEGGELGLFDGVKMPSVKAIMLETHIRALKGKGMRKLFDQLHKSDFYYDPVHSQREVVVFRKIA